jgi:hypothetical protein
MCVCVYMCVCVNVFLFFFFKIIMFGSFNWLTFVAVISIKKNFFLVQNLNGASAPGCCCCCCGFIPRPLGNAPVGTLNSNCCPLAST